MDSLKLALVVGAVVAVPVASVRAQGAAATLDRDAQEVKSYRLSMPVLQKLAAVHKTAAAARIKDPRHQQLAARKAELATLQAKPEPTDAEQERIGALTEEIERLEPADAADADLSTARSLAEMAARIDAQPALAAALRGAGLSSREFATAQLALVQAGIAYGLQKTGHLKQIPDEVSKENVEFVRLHEREIEALRGDWEKAAGGR